MTQDNSALVKRRDSKAATGRTTAVPAKVKAAIAVLLDQPEEDLAAAAKSAGLSTYWLRRYLKQPHVRRYLYAEKQVLVDAVAAGNPMALKKIRDTSQNGMAVVAASRALEILRADTEQASGIGRPQAQSPGVTIIIEAPGHPREVIGGPVIDVTPDEYGPVDKLGG